MRNIKLALLIWTAYFLVAYFSDQILNPYITFPVELVIFITHNLYLFYSLLYVREKFSIKSKKHTIISILRLLLVLSIFFCLKYINIYFIFPLFYDSMPDAPDIIWITAGCLWIINYSLFASAYFYFQSSIKKQKALTQAIEEKLTKEKEKIELEKENIQLENTALRAQINPHFLYNTLDFLYAKALPVSDELSDGVMKLSDIMRYSLKPQDAQGLVSLADEAEHINNIIEMNQLRFSNKLSVDFVVSDIPDNIKIMPLLLITLVENVFKHGVTNSKEHPAVIVLEVTEGNNIHFSTSNKKKTGPKEHSTSIGLNNTLKRLENMYGSRSQVSIQNDADFFSIAIDIQGA